MITYEENGNSFSDFYSGFGCYSKRKAPNSLRIKRLGLFWWCHQESNRGHKDFQSFALPTELWHHHVLLARSLLVESVVSRLRVQS